MFEYIRNPIYLHDLIQEHMESAQPKTKVAVVTPVGRFVVTIERDIPQNQEVGPSNLLIVEPFREA